MRKLFLVGMASAFAVAAFGFSPTKHTNVLTRAGVTYVQRGALGSADYVATNVAMSAADVNALPNNETQLLSNAAFTNAVRAIGGGGGGGGAVPNNALVLSDNVVKTVGGTNALPKEINAVSASEFARPWKKYNGYQRLDTVSYGGKIWVCAENHSGEEVFNEDGHWMDLVSNSVTDKSWVRWHRKWVDDNYAPRGGDVSFGSVQASSVSVGYQGTGTVSANLSGGATIGSGKTLAVNNGATFTIGGSNFNTVVGNAIDAKVLAATNAVVDQVHRITATNGMSAIDGDLGIYDANGHEYDAQNVQGLHYFLNYDANGSPYWTANYKGASWDYHFFIQFVGDGIWHTVCQELDIDRTESAGGLNDNTLNFRAPLGVLYKSAVRNPIRHGSVVPNYVKVAGKPLTNDVNLGTLTINGQSYDGSMNKTINISGGADTNVVKDIVNSSVNGTNTLMHGCVITNNYGGKFYVSDYGMYVPRNGTAGSNRTGGGIGCWYVSGGKTNLYPLILHSGGTSYHFSGSSAKTQSTEGPYSYSDGGTSYIGTAKISSAGNRPGMRVNAGSSNSDLIPDGSDFLTRTKANTLYEAKGEGMDYVALTNTVNAVKEQFYDQPLQVNWTMRMVNGEMKLYATTNVNMSVLQ